MISGEAFDPQFKPINAQMAMLSPKSLRSLGDFKLFVKTKLRYARSDGTK